MPMLRWNTEAARALSSNRFRNDDEFERLCSGGDGGGPVALGERMLAVANARSRAPSAVPRRPHRASAAGTEPRCAHALPRRCRCRWKAQWNTPAALSAISSAASFHSEEDLERLCSSAPAPSPASALHHARLVPWNTPAAREIATAPFQNEVEFERLCSSAPGCAAGKHAATSQDPALMLGWLRLLQASKRPLQAELGALVLVTACPLFIFFFLVLLLLAYTNQAALASAI
jgi:hypothetical protein